MVPGIFLDFICLYIHIYISLVYILLECNNVLLSPGINHPNDGDQLL